MKIIVATGLYPPEIGGPATYAKMLEKELPAHGVEVAIVPFGWVRHYPKIIRHIVYGWKLWQMSRDSQIIYALDPVSVGLPAQLVAKFRRRPFLIRLGGDYAWEQGRVRFGLTKTLDDYLADPKDRPLAVKLLAKIQTHVVSKADKVVAPSKYLKSVIAKWGIPEDKIQVIYSALYPLEVSGTKDQLKSSLSFSFPTIVSAGRLVPWKGFSGLIEVISNLREKYPEINLVIVGDGEERPKLERQVQDNGLAGCVRFTGSISKDALGATIKAADVFVLNTAYEGLSHQLIEVMDLGVPIVTTTAGGNSELITDGVQGLLIEFNNIEKLTEAVARLIDHADTRERVVQSARARAKEFSKDKVVQQVITLLNEYSS